MRNLTDQEPLRDLSVAPALMRGATNILRYLRVATGQLNVPVKVTRDNRPQHVTDGSTETEAGPARLPVSFSFQLDQPVKNARLRIRLPDGMLVEYFRQLPYLPAGEHQYKWLFYHPRPVGTPFTVRLETAAGPN